MSREQCRSCEAEIVWARHKDTLRWAPIDAGYTDQRIEPTTSAGQRATIVLTKSSISGTSWLRYGSSAVNWTMASSRVAGPGSSSISISSSLSHFELLAGAGVVTLIVGSRRCPSDPAIWRRDRYVSERGMFYGIAVALFAFLPLFAWGNFNGIVWASLTGTFAILISSAVILIGFTWWEQRKQFEAFASEMADSDEWRDHDPRELEREA